MPFNDLGAVVLGVSMDDCMSHGTFRDKHGISVELLADTDGEVCRSYDVLQHKEVEGKRKTGILRSTFVIDRERRGAPRAVRRVSTRPRGGSAEPVERDVLNVQIGKNTVVSLTYQLSGSEGNLIEQADQPLTYLHGGYDGIFPMVEQALEGRQVG